MRFSEKIKCWYRRRKKYILPIGGVVLVLVGVGVSYVTKSNKKITFEEWLKNAPTKELDEAYEKLRLVFCKTGTRPFEMEQIGQELGVRGAKEWFEKHPPNTDPCFRWTDVNRWDS